MKTTITKRWNKKTLIRTETKLPFVKEEQMGQKESKNRFAMKTNSMDCFCYLKTNKNFISIAEVNIFYFVQVVRYI